MRELWVSYTRGRGVVMVQRYDLKEDCVTGHIDLEKDSDGGWVGYEDYAKLESAVITLLVDINRRYPGEGFKCPLILKLAEIVEHESRN